MPPKLTDDQLASEIIIQKEMLIGDEAEDDTPEWVLSDDDGWAKP